LTAILLFFDASLRILVTGLSWLIDWIFGLGR
jgi:hypothetical protein